MTSDELQELIDAVDASVDYVSPEHQKALKAVSNLLVDLPDAVVEGLALREPEDERVRTLDREGAVQ